MTDDQPSGSCAERLFVGGPLDGQRRTTPSTVTIRIAISPPIFSAAPESLYTEPATLTYRLTKAPTGEHVMKADGSCWTEAVDTEGWPRRVDPDRASWRRLERWLWRGDGVSPDRPKPLTYRLLETVTYLLADVSKPGAFPVVSSTVPAYLVDAREATLDALAGRQTVEDTVVADLRADMEYELRPLCPVPDCDKKIADHPLVADVLVRPLHIARGASAGWLAPGDELWLCPEHMSAEMRRWDDMGPPWRLFTLTRNGGK